MGPPSSGGSTIAEALNILEGYTLGPMTPADAAPRARGVAPGLRRPRRVHRRPRLLRVPLLGLLSKDFAATRRALIGERAADEPGRARAILTRSTAPGAARR